MGLVVAAIPFYIQKDSLECPFAAAHELAESVRGILDSCEQLLEMLQKFETVAARDMRVRLIDQNMLGDNGPLLPSWDAKGPERANEPVSVDPEVPDVGAHAHVDLVLHPYVLLQGSQALGEACRILRQSKNTATSEDGNLYVLSGLLAVFQLLEKPGVEQEVYDIRPFRFVKPIPEVLHVIQG
eukprot:CAMPEP_0115055354 /NCGR_PEP_ID=MMETSP0227-20121206/4608_1 /TAXON_ID=89957 /ORGANISM="Polarella glacialis, Strain CCMP 1383" /LENGTH=183 /DNA_ID=CAMNT_0002439941 /DNA_START=363 /DNA_END=915 /DNA_ORIENTATION=-